jgi:hypothetical protein
VSPVRHSFSRAITAMHSWSYIGLIGSLKTSVFPVTNEGVGSGSGQFSSERLESMGAAEIITSCKRRRSR